MKHDIEDNEWKQEAPYLASLEKENPFSVPQEYLNTLPELIHGAIYADELKEAISMSGFIVPDQYFNILQDSIFAEATGNGLQDLPKADGFHTPDLYFQKLQANVLAKTADLAVKSKAIEQDLPADFSETGLYAKTIRNNASAENNTATKNGPKFIRLWSSDLVKYASAACFILVTAFGLYLNQQNFNTESKSAELVTEQALYDINEQDIIDHIEGNNVDVSNDHTAVSNKNTAISNDNTAISNDNTANADLETYILNNYSQSDLSSAL
ncbi:hypothetical protein AY601_3396 [Pedobacter cryoconitis]|uniref:Uncharacterized protein n=1 Tax=Pedobacter cryoconitis TaxID=188932 RepID=A0A127VGA1_9SPHI|nr:hypothetical protein [Pedobacter cryoconitis]AMQ00262.1 hypothetical protein AY601_3396 [Pedobacter cryoconitis]